MGANEPADQRKGMEELRPAVDDPEPQRSGEYGPPGRHESR